MELNKSLITGDNQLTKSNVDEIIDVINNNATFIGLQLPDKIYAVVGDTLQLYYMGMITAPNPEKYNFRVTFNVANAKAYTRYLEFTPTISQVGSYTLTVTVLQQDFTVMQTKSCVVEVVDSVQQPATSIEHWCIGDSWTASGKPWPGELLRRLTGTGGTPAGDGYGNITQHVYGNAGKDWNWYAQNTLSPFIYSGVLDFEQYRIDAGRTTPKTIIFLMTWNGMQYVRTDDQWNTWDNDIYTLIDAAKTAFPSVDIILMTPSFCSVTGGLGEDYYPLGQYLSDVHTNNYNMKRQALICQRIANEINYNSFVEFVELAPQFDNLYNMGSSLKNVNTRNTRQEYIGDIGTGIHPTVSLEGYGQVSDALYRIFIKKYCQ